MSNIEGINNATPGVYTNVQTQSTGASVPGGVLIPCIIGEGSTNLTIVASALGGGQDGLNSSFTSSTGAVGRFFNISQAPLVSNRTQLFKNGVTLVGLEQAIPSSGVFSNSYDYCLDPTTGNIELQAAYIINQGGSYYTTGATNIGKGSIQNLQLVDVNAPQETWTIKCVSVQRNNINQPIAMTASFTAFGSVSGNLLDGYGNSVVWVANNVVVSNSILSFSILETSVFNPGDYFTIEVYSGVLSKGDSLTATFIPVANINNPTYVQNMAALTAISGPVSLTNVLSLGGQLAFANDTPGVLAVQAAPPLPRRTSYELVSNFPATSTNVNDFVIPFALGVQPTTNQSIHFFVTNPNTLVETQILPNLFPFYTLGTAGNPTISEFVFDNAIAPSGNSFSYSVVQEIETINFGQDGYIDRIFNSSVDGYFSSASVGSFNSNYLGKQVQIIDSDYNVDIGTFPVIGVTGGVLQITALNPNYVAPPSPGNSPILFSDFITDTSVHFQLIDSVFGELVAGTAGTDGTITGTAYTATGPFSSASINFASFNPVLNNYKLQILSSADASNLGIFDIIAVSGHTITVAKAFTSDHNLKFEVQDPTMESFYLVVNHNVIPTGNSLRVTVVDEGDASFFDAGWETVLSVLETQTLNILVPLPLQTISVIFENAVNHCISMSDIRNRKERVAFIGAINGLTPANLTGQSLAAVESLGILEGIQGNTPAEVLAGDTEDLLNYSVANAYGDTYRCVYFFPDQIVVQVGSDNQTLDGFYIAAAAAGYVAGVPNVAVPLTNKVLSGFSILNTRQFSPTVYQNLAAAGVTSLMPVSGGGLVVWGLTTTQSGAPEEQEISIVFIRDTIAQSFRSGLAGFVGQPGYPNVITNMSAKALALLKSFISQGLITNFANLNIVQDAVDPRQYDISVAVQPVYPINWILVNVGVGVIGS
jgi:hypothetical protein